MSSFPLPFTALHSSYLDDPDTVDDHGNAVVGWADPVPVPCFWWYGDSYEPIAAPAGSDQVSIDINLVVDVELEVDHRDRFTVSGHDFEVVGLPKEWDHGPFGFSPNRRVIELKWIG